MEFRKQDLIFIAWIFATGNIVFNIKVHNLISLDMMFMMLLTFGYCMWYWNDKSKERRK